MSPNVPGPTRVPTTRVALVTSALAALAVVPWLPTALSALFLAAFVVAGPGLVLTSWLAGGFTGLDRILTALVLGLSSFLLGLSVVILVSTLSAFTGVWHTTATTLLLAAATALASRWARDLVVPAAGTRQEVTP